MPDDPRWVREPALAGRWSKVVETEDRDAEPGQESLIDSYCAEFQRLATTLVDLLDVAARRHVERPAGEAAALRRLAPVVERLTAHIARLPVADAAADAATDAAPTPQSLRIREVRIVSDVSGSSLEELCAPAVEASVARELGTEESGLSSEDAVQLWLEEGGSKEPELALSDAPAPDEPEEPESSQDPPEPEAIPPERLLPVLLEEVGRPATLQGTSMSMPIAALFDLLSGSRQSGCLHVRTPTELIRIVLDGGFVVATSTTHPPGGQRLGDLLVEVGLLDRESADAKAAEAKNAAMPIGALLVDHELITLDQLKSALQKQVQARFDRVLRAEHVAYAFVPDARRALSGQIRAHPRELLLESARRTDEALRGAKPS